MKWQWWIASTLLLCAVMWGCASEEPVPKAVDAPSWGQTYATSRPEGSLYACSDCHLVPAAPADTRHRPGHSLSGVTQRPHFWGGSEPDLLGAINHCRYWFMGRKTPWQADNQEARAMYAYLAALPADLPQAQTFTAVQQLYPVPPGDAVAGKATYLAACAWCHGAAVSGQGRLSKAIPRLPQDTFADHEGYTEAEVWAVFVEKVRHGPFWGYGGVMPPFGLEALSDDELGDVLSYLWTLR